MRARCRRRLSLDDATRLLVISGPNMGGKTVALKMTGLFVALTYCGMQVPAAPQTRVGRFRALIADIGDEQSLAAQCLDVFRALTTNVRDSRRRGAADAGDRGRNRRRHRAERRRCAGRCDARAATAARRQGRRLHALDGVEAFRACNAGHRNASVRFDPQTFTPSFELDLGAPGQSLAFPLATRIGIDDDIVDSRDARCWKTRNAITNRRWPNSRRAMPNCARSAMPCSANAAAPKRETAALRERERELDEQRRRRLPPGRRTFAAGLRDFVRELQRRSEANEAARSRRARVTPGQSALLRETIAAVRKDLGITGQEQREPRPRVLHPAIACASCRSISRPPLQKIGTTDCW